MTTQGPLGAQVIETSTDKFPLSQLFTSKRTRSHVFLLRLYVWGDVEVKYIDWNAHGRAGIRNLRRRRYYTVLLSSNRALKG